MCLVKRLLCGSTQEEKHIPINEVIKSLSVSLDQDGPLNPSDVFSVRNRVKLGWWEYLGVLKFWKKSNETESS